jgi:transposase
VPPGRDAQPVQEFGRWTADLERMADWLKACGIEAVVMQSTGVYWIALFDVLEARGFKICLANARHTKNLPGRKTDVQESQWLLKLHTFGLLQNSFRPPDEIRALRSSGRVADSHAKLLAALPAREREAAVVEQEAAEKPPRKKRFSGKRKNAPRFDLHAELERVCGVDLTSIDGIDVMTAQTMVAELGTDFSRWKDETHFASWLGLSPRRDISGGKVLKQGSLKVKNRVATALRTAATTLLHSNSYLGARFRSLQTRRGTPKAIKAMARYLACLTYRMFTRGQAWVDRGARESENRRARRELSALQRKAAAHGFNLVTLEVCA